MIPKYCLKKKRLSAAFEIMENAVSFSTGWVWASEIDRLNIHNASLLAMKRAAEGLSLKADLYLADGKFRRISKVKCVRL